MTGSTVSVDLGDATNVLVFDGADGSSPAPEPMPGKVLLVTFARSPDELLAGLASGDTVETRVIAVGDGVRSTAGASVGPVTTVEHPADLTELGIRVGRGLEDWSDRGFLLEFHSLTALLEHCDLERAFRFLHVLTGQLTQTDATARFHLDPDAVDDTAVATVHSLFDSVLRETDGEWVLD